MVLLFTSDSINLSAKTKVKDGYKLVFREEFKGRAQTMNAKHWGVPKRQNYMWARQISNSPSVYAITKGKLICKVELNEKVNFDINALKQSDFSITMTDGMCAGRKFKVSGSVKENGRWVLTLQRVC